MPVVINSRFTPLTYDEITRPLIEQTQAQEALENAYMEASDQASQIMAQANEQTDPIAYARLKNYSEALQQQAESLMRQGLNRNSRQSLINMRRRYNQDIMPIKSAVERRNTLADEQRKLRVAHPDMLFERDMNTTSLDAFLQNPQLDFGRSYSGLQIQSDVERAIQAVTQGMGSVTVGGSLGNGVRELIKRIGADPEFVEEQIRQGVDANTIFGHIAQSALNKSGVGEWNNAAALNQAKNYALQGYYSGYGKVDRSIIEDYDKRRRDALSDYRARLQIQQNMATGSTTIGGVTAHPAGNYIGENGTKIALYQDNEGNYYTLDKSANGKVKRFVPTDLTPTTKPSTTGSRSSNSGGGYVPQTGYIQIIGGITEFHEKESDLSSHKGDRDGGAKIHKFSEIDDSHIDKVLEALGITIPDDFGKAEKEQLYKELDKYYIVQERVAAPNHRDSEYDWVDIRPRSNSRAVSQIGTGIEPQDYSATYEQLLQQILSDQGQQ